MSKTKIYDCDNFKDFPFNGERVRWEEFHRYLRITINKQEDLPEEWLEYLFEAYPESAGQPGVIDFPAEFKKRTVAAPPPNNASAIIQRNTNDAIKRDEKHNERVRKSKAIFVEILSS